MPKEPVERKEIATRPSSPGITNKTIEQWKPEQLDPELANLAMAKLLVEKMGTPSRITPVFNVRKSLFMALNHVPAQYQEIAVPKSDLDETFKDRKPVILKCINPGKPTGYDASLRIALYENWERGSVNEGGIYFDRVWAFLMKPKYILSGMAGMPMQEEEKGESIIGRAINWFRGGKKNDTNNPN